MSSSLKICCQYLSHFVVTLIGSPKLDLMMIGALLNIDLNLLLMDFYTFLIELDL